MFGGLGKTFFSVELNAKSATKSVIFIFNGRPSTAFSLFHSKSTVATTLSDALSLILIRAA